MKETYKEPPKNKVINLIAEGDMLVATGEIIMKDQYGKEARNAYCDVWRFRDGEIVELKAFVI